MLFQPDPRSIDMYLCGLACHNGSGISSGVPIARLKPMFNTTRSCPETVIIKAHISGAYLSFIMLDKGFVKV